MSQLLVIGSSAVFLFKSW